MVGKKKTNNPWWLLDCWFVLYYGLVQKNF